MLPEAGPQGESSSRMCGERGCEYAGLRTVWREIWVLKSAILRKIWPPVDSREGLSESVWTENIQGLKDSYPRRHFIGRIGEVWQDDLNWNCW